MKYLVLILSLTLCVSRLQAADSKMSWSLTTSVLSQYIGEGGSVFSEDPELITDLIAFKGDWYAGLWVATGLKGGSYTKSYANDYDPYVGWARAFGPVKYEITAIYFAISDLRLIRDDIWVLDQKVSFSKCPVVQPYIKVRSAFEIGSKSFERGMFVWAGIGKSIALGESKLSLDLSTAYSDGAYGKDSGWIFGRAYAGLTMPLSKNLSVMPSFMYQVPASGQKGNPRGFTNGNEVVAGISITRKF
ncbi:MAG TPA: hypothetical protein VGE35_00320 [Candidatus Paceibacterota bacterium]